MKEREPESETNNNMPALSLRKLHVELPDFDSTAQTSENILEILEFTYRDTERTELGDDDMRMLIVNYAACKADILKCNPNLRVLL
jgi:hypothetical protein